jgi:site-specific recombinase XerD
MKLNLVCQQYAAFRRALGERFAVNGRYVRAFSRAMGSDIDIAEVAPDKVNAFLNGSGPLTTTWQVRHNALLGFYRYAISRGFVRKSPLPLTIPKLSPVFQPHIYSVNELRRILDSAESCRRPRSDLDASGLRTLILLMYGAALRTSEALSLKIGDVDLAGAVLTIRDSKFFKSRLVPVGLKTIRILTDYIDHRNLGRSGPDDPFFVGRNSKQIPIHMFERAFVQIRNHAGLRREGGPRCQPRLHDLRHTAAVHRLVSWYREGKDVQKLLHQLSVYMGHTNLAATQVYLSMTPDLLHEASQRFERYAMQEARP